MKKPNLVTLKQYAKMRGVSFQYIYKQVKNGNIIADNIPVTKTEKRIDINKYPVEK